VTRRAAAERNVCRGRRSSPCPFAAPPRLGLRVQQSHGAPPLAAWSSHTQRPALLEQDVRGQHGQKELGQLLHLLCFRLRTCRSCASAKNSPLVLGRGPFQAQLLTRQCFCCLVSCFGRICPHQKANESWEWSPSRLCLCALA